MSKRKEQEAEVEAWRSRRNAAIAEARNFLYGMGEGTPRSTLPRVLFIQGMQQAAGLTTFLDRLQPEKGRRIRVSCRNDDSRDPLFELLAAALWHLVVTVDGAGARLRDALETHTAVAALPEPEQLARMALRSGSLDVPLRFRSFLPDDFGQLARTLDYVDATAGPWRLFADDAMVTKDHRTLAGAMRFRDPANFEIAIGMRWTSEAVNLVDDWRRARRDEVRVVKLAPPSRRGISPRTERKDVHSLFFPVVRDGDTERDGGTDRDEWNAQAIDLIVKTTAALDGVTKADLEQLATLHQAQKNALEQLLSGYDRLLREDGEYRVTPAWKDEASAADLVNVVESALARGTSNPAAEWLVRVARRDAKRSHDDPLASARAVILAAAALYVTSTRAGRQAEAASSASLLARYLHEHTSTPSDRHFAILADLFRDSDHLSIIDYGLSLMAQRSGAPSFDEMRFFRSTCRAARRYSDQQISVEAAARAASDRLRPWIVPLELGLLTDALNSVWADAELKQWLEAFDDRLGEFGIRAEVGVLLGQEARLDRDRVRAGWGRAPRKVVHAGKRTWDRS